MIVELFAGPGGWSDGIAGLGLAGLGFEVDPDAVATRTAAGHATIRADVRAVPVHLIGGVDGLIASPPCPQFSTGGKGLGRAMLAELTRAVDDAFAGRPTLARRTRTMARALRARLLADGPWTRAGAAGFAWDSAAEAALSVQPARWIAALRPRWVAMEQVPAVLPLWQAYRHHLEAAGYSARCAVLDAADFGVPQNRRRAILVARLDGPAALPDPTHCRGGAVDLFGERLPWVSMAAALGLDDGDLGRLAGGPARTLAGNRGPRWCYPDAEGSHGRTVVATRNNSTLGGGVTVEYERDVDRPSPTIRGQARSWELHTRRGWEPDGTAQVVDAERPAPALTPKAGGQWRLENRRDGSTRQLDEPALTVMAGHDNGDLRWVLDRPATTVLGDARLWPPGHKVNGDDEARLGVELARARYGDRAGTGAIRLEEWQALVLQGFDPGRWVAGTRTSRFRQIGNAVPPPLAASVVAALLGLPR